MQTDQQKESAYSGEQEMLNFQWFISWIWLFPWFLACWVPLFCKVQQVETTSLTFQQKNNWYLFISLFSQAYVIAFYKC